MAKVCVDKDGTERIGNMFERCGDGWIETTFDGSFMTQYCHIRIVLPKGSIKKLIGKDLTWEDEPVELKIV